MLKKIISTVLMMAIFAIVPVLAGCAEDEIETHRHVEVHDQVIEQHEVVE